MVAIWVGMGYYGGRHGCQAKEMDVLDLQKIEESGKLLANVCAALKELKDYHAEHDRSEDGYLETVRALECAVGSAHSKWQKFAEKNFWSE